MGRWQRVRKYSALTIAVGLIAAFVLYRAGFGGPVMSNTKSTFIFVGSGIRSTAPTKPSEPAPLAVPDPQAPANPGE
jgi:hypothetical protein